MTPEQEEILEQLRDSRCEVAMAYSKHLDECASRKANAPDEAAHLFDVIEQRIIAERDVMLGMFDTLIDDMEPK